MNMLEMAWRWSKPRTRTTTLKRVFGQDGGLPYPYTQRMELQGVTFDYWVPNSEGRGWYDPALHGSLPENAELARLLEPGDRVLELGAHHGFYAAWMAKKVGANGLVVALDPVPFNAMMTNAQFALNGLANGRVFAAAASDRPGRLRVSYESNCRVVSEGMPVPAITGDELDAEFGPFTVLKLDVEGYERQVLEGCRRLLARRPKIALEIHANQIAAYQTDIPQLMALIDSDAYEGTIVDRSNRKSVMQFTPPVIPRKAVSNLFLWPRVPRL